MASEQILAEQGGKSGNGPRYPILFYVPKGATERRVHGVLHRRTDRTLRDGTAVFEAVPVGDHTREGQSDG